MVKERVDMAPLMTVAQVEALLSRWGRAGHIELRKLYGGFSGSNYLVLEGGGRNPAVLKVCHSYSVEEAALQAEVLGHLGECGFGGSCTALPLADAPSRGSSRFITDTEAGEPAMLLTYREGQAADSVIEAGVDACRVLYEVGVNLARLHQVPPAPHLRSFEHSGACNLGDHVADRWTPLFRASEHTAAHPFVSFYEARVKALQELVRMNSLPTGIIHGDPFLDNILVDAESGAFKAFVDFEDSCVGPLLFDVACTAAAGCYRPAADGGPDVLEMQLLRDLLRGYASVRRFEEHEAAAFVPFMRMALLCNCTWRFKNFNLDHLEVESCRDAYRELQWRIEDLEQAERVGAIDELVRAAMATV